MLATIAKLMLRLGGWTMVGSYPDVPKAVLIAAPHTSNWDGYWGLTFRVAAQLDIKFFAKRSLFWFPLGPILRALGGVPLDRSRAGGAVQQAVDMFRDSEYLCFGLSPEGTRKWAEYWKTGFYRIAEQAGVPIVLAFFDYRTRRIGFGGLLELSGNREADLDTMRDFYSGFGARRPENVGPVQFRPEPEEAREAVG